MSHEIESTMLFGVPLFRKRFPAFFDRQDAVVRYVLTEQQIDPGQERSNFGGWHSSENFHQSENSDVQWLMQRIFDESRTCVKRFEGGRQHDDVRILAAWANVNMSGAWNMPHMHLPAQWSGVFYVTLGDMDKNAAPGAHEGSILFFDPLPLGERFKRPTTQAIAPEAGTMLLFPSYVTHMVTPYHGESPRISIAFNLAVEYPTQ